MRSASETLARILPPLAPPPTQPDPPVLCSVCRDLGWTLHTDKAGERYVQDCVCREARKAESAARAMGIPPHFAGATLENYRPRNEAQSAALIYARGIADAWPTARGLLLYGPCGTGKTHLAAGLLRRLQSRGAACRWFHCREVLRQVKDTYGGGETAERAVLRPVVETPVVVLDEAGAAEVTPWSMDQMQYLIGARYDAGLCTIVTTNYPLRAEAAVSDYKGSSGSEQTLLHRIGQRAASRLFGMCEPVAVSGEDYRLSQGGAW